MPNILRISDSASMALHTMSLLARHPKRRFGNREIADLLECSEYTLQKVMQRLVKAGLAQAVRGPGGGFMLNRDAEDINVLEIYEAIDGMVGNGDCEQTCLLGSGACVSQACILGNLSIRVNELVRDTFSETSLQRLAGSMRLGDAEYGPPEVAETSATT